MSNTGMNGFDDKLEFAPGSVFGFRLWSVDATGMLYGSYGQTWQPGENQASCMIMNSRAHAVPLRDCGCGFWAYWTPPNISSMSIMGVAEGYGRTLIGEKGFRAEKAVIKGLAVLPEAYVWGAAINIVYNTTNIANSIIVSQRETPPSRSQIADRLNRTYQVPVFMSIQELVRAFPPSAEYIGHKDPCSCPICNIGFSCSCPICQGMT